MAVAVATLTLSLAPGVAQAEEPAPAEPTTQPAAGSTTEPETQPAPAAAPAGVPVRLKVGRKPARRVSTSRSYPPALLRDEGVRTARRDLVRVVRDGRRVRTGAQRALQPHDTVQVVRVDVHSRQWRAAIAPRTVTRRVTTLAPGARRVAAPGRAGVRLVRVTRTLHNWRQVDRDVQREVVRTPRTRRVLVGAPRRSVAGADRLRWGALANCESSGNPRAVNPAGYYGLYQFNVATWRSVGGSGMPHHASPAEQTYRAKLLYRQRGRSPWPHCGRLL